MSFLRIRAGGLHRNAAALACVVILAILGGVPLAAQTAPPGTNSHPTIADLGAYLRPFVEFLRQEAKDQTISGRAGRTNACWISSARFGR